MAVSEQTIQEAFQDTLRGLNIFDDADVTINDWGVLDQSTQAAPYVIIENSDEWRSRQDTTTATDFYSVPLTLVEAVDTASWETTMNNFRDHRQAIRDAVNTTGTVRSAGGQAGVDIVELRSDGPIGYIYPQGIDPEYMADATPVYVTQRMVLIVEEF